MKRIAQWWEDANYNYDGAPTKVAIMLGLFVGLALIIWFFVAAPLAALIVFISGIVLAILVAAFWLIATFIWEEFLE